MKYLIVLVLALLPFSVAAQNKDRSCETERVITKEDGRVSEERRVVCKEKTREVFSDCERYRWEHQWGQTNVVSCNWTEYDAMQVALTHAHDGVKIEWYDNVKGTKGAFTAWTLAPTQLGSCRELTRSRKYSGAVEKDVLTYCYNNSKQAWYEFRR